jgi:hypothetical protein
MTTPSTSPSIAQASQSLALPEEVMIQILSYLDWSSLITLSYTFIDLQDMVEPHIWSYYNLDARQRGAKDHTWRKRASSPDRQEDDHLSILSRIIDNAPTFARDWVEYRHDFDQLWASLRAEDLKKAITTRPQRMTYVKELCFGMILGDLHAGDVVVDLWPHLRSAMIEMIQQTDSGRFPTDIDGWGLPISLSLRDIRIGWRGSFGLLNQLLHLVPNLQTLRLEIKRLRTSQERQLEAECGTDRIHLTRTQLKEFAAHGIELDRIPYLAEVVRASPMLENLEITGLTRTETGQLDVYARPLALALSSCPRLERMTWVFGGYPLSSLFNLCQAEDIPLPRLRQAVLSPPNAFWAGQTFVEVRLFFLFNS